MMLSSYISSLLENGLYPVKQTALLMTNSVASLLVNLEKIDVRT